ncbi:MAG TPA: bifunctional phosphoribosylaminoimidazolecarboxamide formyltransferase/IMP cyclohydrolase [Phycisphaerae bacterium]|nr:bifunctional phosphoribosylaminoimidazolecarboxamide formyltransferase/IMP cyclohydrolase [Phycisphaerae bacterium]
MSGTPTTQPQIRRALISVYDKTGIVDFARALHDEFGVEIISTGGTATTLQQAGIPVTLVEQITGFPEMLDGRVKTLHPRIHAAILADRDNPEHMRQLKEQGIEPIDMVVVNLYPFEKTIADPNCTFEQAIEMIDIGGPCLLRAAAKNHKHVAIVPNDYPAYLKLLREGRFPGTAEARAANAARIFAQTASYDSRITAWLQEAAQSWPRHAPLWMLNWGPTRYGENPHQKGELLSICEDASALNLARASEAGQEGAQTKLSYNNYADASAALELAAELTRAMPGKKACCFIKHTNACGVAAGPDAIETYRKAYLGDPNAAMGGILAVNFEVDAAFAEVVMQTYAQWGKAAGAGGFFVEVWLAPAFAEDALQIIRTRKEWGKRVRLLAVGDMSLPPDPKQMDFKRIAGGMLMQTRDLVGLNEEQWKVVTTRQPTDSQLADLRLAWLICKHTKSNAITVCRDGMLLGNGAGQMSRVMSCRIATWLAKENGHAEALTGAVAASDAFFPFRDGPDILIDAGVTALIQPGGSKNDQQVIDACNERNVAMIFTGTRHFKH